MLRADSGPASSGCVPSVDGGSFLGGASHKSRGMLQTESVLLPIHQTLMLTQLKNPKSPYSILHPSHPPY